MSEAARPTADGRVHDLLAPSAAAANRLGALSAGVCLALAVGACGGGAPTQVGPAGSGGAPTSSGGDSRGGTASGGGTQGGTATGGATQGATATGGGTPSGGSGTGGRSGTGGVPSTGGTGTQHTGGTSGEGGSAAGGAAAGTGQGATGGALAHGGQSGAAGGGGSAAGHSGSAGGAGAGACAGLICEDFENGSVDAGKWDTVSKGGTLAIEQQQVAHGKYALQVHGASSGADDWAFLVAKNVPAALKGTATFGRAYVYVAQGATSSIHIQLAFAGRDGTGTATGPSPFPKLRYMEVATYSGGWQLGFDLLDVSPSVEEVSYPKARVPTNKWACLEWQFEDHPDRVTIWVDGAQAGTFDNTNVAYASPGPVPKSGAALYDGTSTDLVGGFESFGFGFHDWHPVSAFDLYYDDLVLDVKRIECLP